MAQHEYKQIEQIIKVNLRLLFILKRLCFNFFDLKESKKNVKEQQDILLKQYMLESIGPIVDSIENNLYAGRYDFNDSSKPISK
jgi:hypothetical protein